MLSQSTHTSQTFSTPTAKVFFYMRQSCIEIQRRCTGTKRKVQFQRSFHFSFFNLIKFGGTLNKIKADNAKKVLQNITLNYQNQPGDCRGLPGTRT
jgi:hypothetical protein